MTWMRGVLTVAMVLCAVGSAAVRAADVPSQNVVSLSASASLEVTKDRLGVMLNTTREGDDPAAVQSALKQALEAALIEAKKAAHADQIEVQTGNFSLFPRRAAKGGIVGWQGTAELLIEGRDIAGIAQLTGRITTLTVARVGTQLSREQRDKVEGEVAAQAIARYRAKAAEYAHQFGFAGYTLREINVSANESNGYTPMPMMRAAAAAALASDTLPVEPGRATVSVTVSGAVQLVK